MARYYQSKGLQLKNKPKELTEVTMKKYGRFVVNETRVILIDRDMKWVPTDLYPIWGSKKGVVGTVAGFLASLDRVRIQWDNGMVNTFHFRYLERYDERKHGAPRDKKKLGPNTTFKVRKKYGEFR